MTMTARQQKLGTVPFGFLMGAKDGWKCVCERESLGYGVLLLFVCVCVLRLVQSV